MEMAQGQMISLINIYIKMKGWTFSYCRDAGCCTLERIYFGFENTPVEFLDASLAYMVDIEHVLEEVPIDPSDDTGIRVFRLTDKGKVEDKRRWVR